MYGGSSLLLEWVRSDVVPAVLTALGLQLGEITLHGFSLGGLTACYGAATRPDLFARAWCASPSVWWNYGGESSQILQTDNLTTIKKSSTS